MCCNFLWKLFIEVLVVIILWVSNVTIAKVRLEGQNLVWQKVNFFLEELIYLCCSSHLKIAIKMSHFFKVQQYWKGEGSSARNSSAQKNCSTPKSWLLGTVQADDKNIWICSKIKKVCCTCLVEQMQVLDQNVQLLE